MTEFIKTMLNGYSQLFNDAKLAFFEHGPKILTGSGTGLMMIGSALIARDSCKAEVQQAIAEANNLVAEAETKNNTTNAGDSKAKKKARIFKAKFHKGLKIVKVYKKGFILDAIGGISTTTGICISENGRHKAIAGAATLGGILSSYRAAVVADLGPEADIKYMNGEKVVNVTKKKGKKDETDNDANAVAEEASNGGVTIYKDPNAFRLLFSKESTPSVWNENYDIRKANLEWIEATLSRYFMNTWETGGALTLNDMRREFDKLNPSRMDVDIGGIFGRVYERNDPKTHRLINLHWREDKDFMDGRKDYCYVYFDCDPEPIIGRTRKRFTQVEKG